MQIDWLAFILHKFIMRLIFHCIKWRTVCFFYWFKLIFIFQLNFQNLIKCLIFFFAFHFQLIIGVRIAPSLIRQRDIVYLDFGRKLIFKKAVKIQSLKFNKAFGCATTLNASLQIPYELIKIRLLPILAPNFPPIIQLYLKVYCATK